MTVTLTPAEIEEITGLVQPAAQLRTLRRWGLPAQMRANNTVSLGRAHYEQWQPGEPERKIDRPKVRIVRAVA